MARQTTMPRSSGAEWLSMASTPAPWGSGGTGQEALTTQTRKGIYFQIFYLKDRIPIFSPRRKWNIKITFDDGHNEAYKYFIKIARLHTKYWSIGEREIQVAIMVIFAIQFYHPMNHSDQSDRISKWQISKVWNTGLYQHSHRDESLMCSQNV